MVGERRKQMDKLERSLGCILNRLCNKLYRGDEMRKASRMIFIIFFHYISRSLATTHIIFSQ